MVGWITWAYSVHAQGADAPCNPAGDDNKLLYCVWTVEPRFGGMSIDQSDANVLRVLPTGDDSTDAAAARVLAEVNRLWDRTSLELRSPPPLHHRPAKGLVRHRGLRLPREDDRRRPGRIL